MLDAGLEVILEVGGRRGQLGLEVGDQAFFEEFLQMKLMAALMTYRIPCLRRRRYW